MDDTDRTVGRVDGPEQRKDDSVITTKGNDPRMVFAIERDRSKWLAGDRVITQRRVSLAL